MENDSRKKKMLYIFAMLVCSIALTVGFAAYAQTLHIDNIRVDIKPSNSLNIHFPSTGTIIPEVSDNTVTANTINLNSGTVIANLKASFTKPGQYVIYRTVFINDSTFPAFLKNVYYTLDSPRCEAINDVNSSPASMSVVNSICENMKMYVTVDGLVNNIFGDEIGITGKYVPESGSVPVTIKIAYEGDIYPDGDLSVNFGDVYFNFSATDYTE